MRVSLAVLGNLGEIHELPVSFSVCPLCYSVFTRRAFRVALQ